MGWESFRDPISAWTHLLWMLFALPGTWVLWRLARGNRVKQISLLIFGLGLVLCYGASGVYHTVPARYAAPFGVLDHIGIYVLIAATGTPVCAIVLRGRLRVGLLICIWTLALTGIILALAGDLPQWPRTFFYLALGWLGCVAIRDLLRHFSWARIRPLWMGGLFYTIGAIIFLKDWPALAPGIFGAHELFHVFVMLGSLCHYHFMLFALVPFVRVEPVEAVVEAPAEEPLPVAAQLAQQPLEG
jgi:hemolysin III